MFMCYRLIVIRLFALTIVCMSYSRLCVLIQGTVSAWPEQLVMGRINRPMMNRFLDEPVRLTSLKQEAGIFLALESPWPIDVKENFTWRLSMKIADIMTTNPDWCVPEASTTQAARIMKRMNVGIVPVLSPRRAGN
jgi:CBS domain-containing protein